MRIDYVAFDGQRFGTKEECLKHESEGRSIAGWKTYEDSLTNYEHFLGKINPMPYRLGHSPRELIDSCTIVYIENDESLEVAKAVDPSLEKGFNFWDGIKYVPAEMLIGNYRQAMANMESLLKVLKKEIGIEN